jgi:hypothetical protein
MRTPAPASRAGPATMASDRSRDVAWRIGWRYPAGVLSRSSTDSGDAAPAIIARAVSACPRPRLRMRPIQEVEITGSVSGASRRSPHTVRRSSRHPTRTSMPPDVIGCAIPATSGSRIIAFQHPVPLRLATRHQHQVKSRHLTLIHREASVSCRHCGSSWLPRFSWTDRLRRVSGAGASWHFPWERHW